MKATTNSGSEKKMNGVWTHDAYVLVHYGHFHAHGRKGGVQFGHFTHPDFEDEVPAIRYDDGVVLLPSDWQAYSNVEECVDGKSYLLPQDYQEWAADGLADPDEDGWPGDEIWLENWTWLTLTGRPTFFFGGLPRKIQFRLPMRRRYPKWSIAAVAAVRKLGKSHRPGLRNRRKAAISE